MPELDRVARRHNSVLYIDDAHATVLDVRDVDAVNQWAGEVVERQGRVDVLVNNVGDYRPIVRFERSGPESWGEMFEINFRHVLAVTRVQLLAIDASHPAAFNPNVVGAAGCSRVRASITVEPWPSDNVRSARIRRA